MRTGFLVVLLAPLLASAADQPKVKNKPAPAAQAKADAIPPEAKQIEPGLYRWTDKQGKTWILRKGPFGLFKAEEQSARAEATEDLPGGMTVVEEGDELRFERPTPFGLMRWKKKKTELNEMEQRAWERKQNKKAGDGQDKE